MMIFNDLRVECEVKIFLIKLFLVDNLRFKEIVEV